jgi:hypothetical protein
MRDAVRPVLPVAAQPPQLPLRQTIKEGEAEIAETPRAATSPPRALARRLEQIHSAVLLPGLAPFQPHPSLGTPIKEAHQFAGKAGRILGAQAAQRRELASHGVEVRFIQPEDLSSKGGERGGYRLGTGVGPSRIDRLPQLLEGNQARLQKPFDQAIAREPDGSKRT